MKLPIVEYICAGPTAKAAFKVLLSEGLPAVEGGEMG